MEKSGYLESLQEVRQSCRKGDCFDARRLQQIKWLSLSKDCLTLHLLGNAGNFLFWQQGKGHHQVVF